MTQTSSHPHDKGSSKIAGTANPDKRTIVLKVRVNQTEKSEIDRQKARLSYSGFLRDRGLNRGTVYDPTYAAIGGVYQSARNLRDSANCIASARGKLDEFLADRVHGEETEETETMLKICCQLREVAEKLFDQGARIKEQADSLGRQARDLSRTHLQEMLKRYPAPVIKPRKHR